MNPPEQKVPANEVVSNDLVRAIFEAGFRSGYAKGSDDATTYEWGCGNRKPDPRKAWEEDAKWRIETDGSYRIDASDPNAWAYVP